MSNNASKNWCFTLNNYTPEELSSTQAFAQLSCDYLIYGVELGENLTPHLQGYFQLKDRIRIDGLKRLFNPRAHLEKALGTALQNRKYCSKDRQFLEFGTIKTQGGRSDLQALGRSILTGTTVADIAESDPEAYIRYHRGLSKLADLQIKPRNFKTEVLWYYGPTGTGKSKLAHEENPTAYWKDPTNKWWDGYEGEDVIIDDFRRDFCTFAALLRLFDRYPLTIEYKGGTTQFRSKRIVITSPKSPEDTWEGRTEEDLQQLLRRITLVKFFSPNPIF